MLDTLAEQLSRQPFFPAANKIGGAVAANTRLLAVYALVASWGLIILYLWIRFQGVAFGVAAVIALIHDVLVMLGGHGPELFTWPRFLGFLLVEPFKINLPIVAAFLTIIGYSVNDTIVVFDRIREVRGKDPQPYAADGQRQHQPDPQPHAAHLVHRVPGGDHPLLLRRPAIHGFAFALIWAWLTGTYSSIYVAAPILLWMIGKHDMKPASQAAIERRGVAGAAVRALRNRERRATPACGLTLHGAMVSTASAWYRR